MTSCRDRANDFAPREGTGRIARAGGKRALQPEDSPQIAVRQLWCRRRARGGDAGQGTVVEEANEGPGGLGSLEGPESRERARPPSDRERATD